MNSYLARVFYIIEEDSKQKNMLSNDVKLRINLIDQIDTDVFKEIFSVANTIRKLYIQKHMHLIYQQDFYKDIQKELGDLFY